RAVARDGREVTTFACELYALVELLEAKGVLQPDEHSARVGGVVQARGDQTFEEVLEALTDGAISRIDEDDDTSLPVRREPRSNGGVPLRSGAGTDTRPWGLDPTFPRNV